MNLLLVPSAPISLAISIISITVSGLAKKMRSIFIGTIVALWVTVQVQAQTTPPPLNSNVPWNAWWGKSTVEDIQNQFNIGRRAEETQLELTDNSLGNLTLPTDYLSLDYKEQAFILLNLERKARGGIYYPSPTGGSGITATGREFEGVDADLSGVAQDHADDMQENDFFGHNSDDGTAWNVRITAPFPGCYQGVSENIAWNSISNPNGFILGVQVAIYGFIYDDACCGWGHRNLCLKQTGNNDYGDPNKIGLVGFGRAPGTNGDYFVMDYIDPRGTCNFEIIDFGSSGGCEDILVLSQNNQDGYYQADLAIESTGSVMAGGSVTYVAGEEISLMQSFEVGLGSSFTTVIEDCTLSIQSTNTATIRSREPIIFRKNIPEMKKKPFGRRLIYYTNKLAINHFLFGLILPQLLDVYSFGNS